MKHRLLFLTVFLAGCRGGYQAPDITLNTEFLHPVALHDEDTFNPRFWEFLQDPVLNHLVEMLERENYDIAIAQEKISELRAQYRYQNSQFFPQINAGGSIKRERDTQTLTFSQFTGTKFQTQYALGFDSSWELDLFGSQQAAKQSAFFNMMSQTEKVAYTKVTLVAELCMQYIQLRSEQALVDAYKKELESLKELEKLSSERFTTGLVDQNVTLLNMARYQEKEALIQKKQADIDKLIFFISRLTGQFPDEEYELLSQFKPLNASLPIIHENIPSQIVLSRPDVAATRYELFSAQALLKKAYRDFFPQFSITSAYGLLSNFSNQLFKRQSLQWNIMPGFNVTVIDFGALIAEKNVAKSQEKQALLNYENSLVRAFNEIESALSGVQNIDLQIQSLEEEMMTLNSKTHNFQERFRSGLISKSSFLESYIEELLIEQRLIEAIQNRLGFAIAFYKAIGVRL